MVWCALLYAATGSWLSWRVGRRLISLNAERYAREADLRFALVRVDNRRSYYGIELPAGPDFGGPLFFSQYSFCGLDPRDLNDRYADYWRQNVNHTLITMNIASEIPTVIRVTAHRVGV
jgi:Putative glucoamylase